MCKDVRMLSLKKIINKVKIPKIEMIILGDLSIKK